MPKLPIIIQLAGLAHILLALGSFMIPKLLNWKDDLLKVSTIIRQMFWTYAGYILAINVFFGIVSILFPHELVDGSGLAKSMTILIFLYWFARLVIQFTYFDKSDLPSEGIYRFGEIGLIFIFVFFSVVYGWAVAINFGL